MNSEFFNPETETGRTEALRQLGFINLPPFGNFWRNIIDKFKWQNKKYQYKGKGGRTYCYNKMMVIDNHQLKELKNIVDFIKGIKANWLRPTALAKKHAGLNPEMLRQWADSSQLIIKITKEKVSEAARVLSEEKIWGVKLDKELFFNPKVFANHGVLKQLLAGIEDYKKRKKQKAIGTDSDDGVRAKSKKSRSSDRPAKKSKSSRVCLECGCELRAGNKSGLCSPCEQQDEFF